MNKSKVTLFLLLILALGGLTGCAFSDWIARLLGNDVLIARYEAETAASKQAEAYELRLLREADVDLQDEINEGMIYKQCPGYNKAEPGARLVAGCGGGVAHWVAAILWPDVGLVLDG